MTKPQARISTLRVRRRMDAQQIDLFGQPTARSSSGDCTAATFVGPLRNNPYRRRVLRMREMWAAEARTGGAA